MTLATGAQIFTDHLFTFDDDNYENQIRKARLVPSSEDVVYKTAVPGGTYVFAVDPTWTLELEGLQINATGGLADAMRTAVGTVVTCTLQPKSGATQKIATFDIRVPPLPFGGEEGAVMVIDLTIAVQGQPVYSTSA